MKATGIVRRVDDLGRVVIPKEIRRAMRIEPGSPLEIYTEQDAVCFRLYRPYGVHDWEKVFKALRPIIPCPFVLFNNYKEVEKVSPKFTDEPDFESIGELITIRDDEEDVAGYIGVAVKDSVTNELVIAAAVAKAILGEG